MVKNIARLMALLLLVSMAGLVSAQSLPPVDPAMEANNLYFAEVQWGGADAEWYTDGLWVLGGRAGQPVVALELESTNDGETMEGFITYAGEGPIFFYGEREYANTYAVEVQWGSGFDASDWNFDGYWVIGGRQGQPVVSANLSLNDADDALVGNITYAGEGPITFYGTPVDGGVYRTDNWWGEEPPTELFMGGIWVMGNRADQQVVSVVAESADGGETLQGQMTYEGEGPIGFYATHITGNVYMVENQWGGSDADWNVAGYWVIGGRDEQRIVALDIAQDENGLSGTITYEGEGPIGFYAYSLQAYNELNQG